MNVKNIIFILQIRYLYTTIFGIPSNEPFLPQLWPGLTKAKFGIIIPVSKKPKSPKEEDTVRLHLNKCHKTTNLNQTK